MATPFDQYPLLLKAQDIMDATQYGMTYTYELIRQAEAQVPGSVIRGKRKGTRVRGDLFWPWFMKRVGMSIPEEMKVAE